MTDPVTLEARRDRRYAHTMRKLSPLQQQVVVESAEAVDEVARVLKKRHTRLAAHGVLPRFVRALLESAEIALADVSVGLIAWADGQLDEDGLDACDRADTEELAVDQAEEYGN